MKENITFAVTDEHIKNGKLNCTHCPIALAIHEQFPNHYVSVSSAAGAYVISDDEIEIYELDIDSKLFISHFDQGLPVSSFTGLAEYKNTEKI